MLFYVTLKKIKISEKNVVGWKINDGKIYKNICFN